MRAARLDAFVAGGPWAGAAVAPLAGDASNRRYLRLTHPERGPAVLMDAPPERGEDVAPFLDVTERLRTAGYSAPQVLDADPDQGFLLLEDLGDRLFARHLEHAPQDETALYGAAVALLADLHRRPRAADGLPPYDLATLWREAALVTDWYLPGATGVQPDGDTVATYRALVETACEAPNRTPPVCVLRDYHAENLLWLPDHDGLARVGLLDYQDALAGHPAYDLVSLLEDARRDTSPALREAMTAEYLGLSGAEPQAFTQAYATLGAQRNLKILGIFARLWLRDGKPQYLDLMPRVWDHLQRDLTHPALSDLGAWVSEHVPPPDAATRAALRAAR